MGKVSYNSVLSLMKCSTPTSKYIGYQLVPFLHGNLKVLKNIFVKRMSKMHQKLCRLAESGRGIFTVKVSIENTVCHVKRTTDTCNS